MEKQPCVFLVDDSPDFCKYIENLLKSIDLPTRQYSSATTFLEYIDHEAIGCLVLDVRLPGMSGLEMQQRLLQIGSDMPVLLVSGHADVPMAVRGIKAGAIDFFEKPFNDQEFMDRVQQGIAEHYRRRKHRAEQFRVNGLMDRLTPREREVMELMVTGMSNRDIAENLKISRKTLDIHRGKVLQKMETDTISELVRMVYESRAPRLPGF